MNDILLGVNVDHIATLRQARGTNYPDPVYAASVAEHAGADGITVHLREDRRHIQDRDIYVLKQTLHTRMNFEMAVTEEMLAIACEVKPVFCCLVPEKREELTTEGGLDVAGQQDKINVAVARLAEAGIQTSLFIDADKKQIDAAVLKGEIEKKQSQIDFLTKAKDDLEGMIMQLQKQMLDNQDDVMDKVILKAALDYDDRAAALKALNKTKE